MAIAGLAAGPAAAIGLAAGNEVPVSVRPATGRPQTRFVVSFRAPSTTAGFGSTSQSYEIDAAGPSRRRCGSNASAPVGPTHTGARVRMTLGPPRPTRAWCVGTYHGRLREIIRPECQEGKACPMFIAILTVGTFKFRVT
jgi:hypothetical protein